MSSTTTDNVYAADGTTSEPGFAFISDHKTGLTHSAGPKMTTCVDGTPILEMTSTNCVSHVPVSFNNVTATGSVTLGSVAPNGFLSTDGSQIINSTSNHTDLATLIVGDSVNDFTMVQRTAQVVRIGPLVFLSAILSWTSKGSAVSGSDLVIRGLPYPSSGINYTGNVGVLSGPWTTSAPMSVQYNYPGPLNQFLNVYQNPATGVSSRVSCGMAPSVGGIRFTILYCAA